MKTPASRTATIACALLLLDAACGGGAGTGEGAGAARPPAGPPKSLLVLSLDTLRADHLGAYGYTTPTSPNFDAFAKRAVLFTDCMAASSHTLASHKAILSGRWPDSFLRSFSEAGGSSPPTGSPVSYYQEAFKGWSSPPLASRLKAGGLATLALVDGGYMKPAFGLDTGFDGYSSGKRLGLYPERLDEESWLSENGAKPFFVLMHSYDIHCPYDPPADFLKKFEASCTGPIEFEGRCGKYFNQRTLSFEDKLHIRRHYDAGILREDDELGRLIDGLEKMGRFDDTIIVITSDHGESLGEHDTVGHGGLYENQIKVPLAIYVPGVAPGVVSAPVSGVDLAPTVLDLLTGEIPSDVDGWSLRGLIESAHASAGSAPGGSSSPAGDARTKDGSAPESAGDGGAARGASGPSPAEGGSPAAGGERPGSRPASHSVAEFASRPRFALVSLGEGKEDLTHLRKIAVADGSGFKLIVDLDTGKGELYDLRTDPGEAKNLFGQGRAEEARLIDLAKKHDPGPLKGYDPALKIPGHEVTGPEIQN